MNVQHDLLLVQLQEIDGKWVDVGVLRSSNNTNWFESIPSYWRDPARPVLGQVFEENGPAWRPNAHTALPHWFSHLLPEGRLREAVASAANIHTKSELALLAKLGADDLPGAIRVLQTDKHGDAIPPEVRVEADAVTSSDPVLKFSLAGLQMKFSVHRSDKGLTIPVSGRAGNMILKLPDPRPGFEGVPEAEFAAMALASTIGIPTPEIGLVDAKDIPELRDWAERSPGNSFIIGRYDRKAGGGRVHAEEFAQVMGVSASKAEAKYQKANFETVANVASQHAGREAVADVIDRIVLNVLVGNGDAHLKNWSFVYLDGRLPSLSPVYDVVPTIIYVKNDNLGLNLSGSKAFQDVTTASFERLGERSGFGAEAARARAAETAERVVSHWTILRDLLPAAQFALLDDRLRSLPLARL